MSASKTIPDTLSVPLVEKIRQKRNVRYHSISFASQLPSRFSLIGDNTIVDISAIGSAFHITHLSLKYCTKLTDISCLSGLVNLRYLNLISADSLTDLTPLKYLVNLKRLVLCGCESINDLSPLMHLKKLRYLDLSCCDNIVDISPLSCLRSLRTLELGYCFELKDISGLKQLTRLKRVNIAASGVTSIDPIKRLSRCSRVCVCCCDELTEKDHAYAKARWVPI